MFLLVSPNNVEHTQSITNSVVELDEAAPPKSWKRAVKYIKTTTRQYVSLA